MLIGSEGNPTASSNVTKRRSFIPPPAQVARVGQHVLKQGVNRGEKIPELKQSFREGVLSDTAIAASGTRTLYSASNGAAKAIKFEPPDLDVTKSRESKETTVATDARTVKEDSIDISRRRMRQRRSRHSAGNSTTSAGRNSAAEKVQYIAGKGSNHSISEDRRTAELQNMTPEERTFACQLLNELKSTYLLRGALAHSSPSASTSFVDANWTNNVYINNLPPQTADEELCRIGRTYGKVKSHKAIINPNTGLCKGYGFVMYETLEEAELALQQLPLHGLTASWAKESFTAKLRRMADLTTANVYLSNLPLEFTSAQLEELFAPHRIVSMRLLVEPETRKPKGVGFVRLESRETAQECIDKLHGRTLPGQTTAISVRFADSDAQKQLKQTTRSLSPSDTAHDSAKSSGPAQSPFYNPYLQSSLMPAWPTLSSLNHEQALHGRNSSKENLSPQGVPPGLGFTMPHSTSGQPSFALTQPQLMAQNLLHHNMAMNGYLSHPSLAPPTGLLAHQHPLGLSPMLSPSPLSLSPSHLPANCHRIAPKSTSNPSYLAQSAVNKGQNVPMGEVGSGIEKLVQIKSPAPLVLQKAAEKHGNADFAGEPTVAGQGRQTNEEPDASASPSHPLSSTPLRPSVPVPPGKGKTPMLHKYEAVHNPEEAVCLTPSTSSVSSLGCPHALPLRTQSACDARELCTSNDVLGRASFSGQNRAGVSARSVATASSACDSYKTGRERSSHGSADGDSDSLEVYCGAQAPINIHCPRPCSSGDESTSLSKTDSGKDVDQRSLTDAATSFSDKNSPPNAKDGSVIAEQADRSAKALGFKIGGSTLVPSSPSSVEPMPLSEPATIVPE